ncbi:MAG: S41 family peptidase [Pseudomonadota bacterium]
MSTPLKSAIVFLACLLSLGSIAAASPEGERWLSAAQIHTDIDLAAETYRRVHPGFGRYTAAEDIEQAWSALKQEALDTNGMSVGDLYIAIERVLTLIRCDHTKAELPLVMKAERRTMPVYLPARWTWVETRGIIQSAPIETGLHPGDEIIEIDGTPLQDMVAQVRPLIPVDGFATWSADAGIAASLEFMGGAVDHFGALLWEVQPTATILVERTTGERETVRVDRVTFDAWTALGAANGSASDFKDAVLYEDIGSNAGYLRVDTFVNYRKPIEPDDLYAPVFKALKQDGREHLILDLRKNGGGSSDAQMRLLQYLIEKPVTPIRNICARTLNMDGIRDHLWTWDKRALSPNRFGFKRTKDGDYCLRSFVDSDLKSKKPARFAFKGELLVLTSRANSSASTSLISILQAHRPVTLIGETTGGSPQGPTAGVQFTLTLPESGIRTRVPFLRYFNNVSGVDDESGLMPDIQIVNTVAAARQGKDLALDEAKRLIAKID